MHVNAALTERLHNVTTIAKSHGQERAFEFELSVLRWEVELLARNAEEVPPELERFVLRHADVLRDAIERAVAAA